MTTSPPVPAIDIVSGIWTEEALSYRPGWQDQFFAGKMKSKTDMKGVSLDDQLAQMADGGDLYEAVQGLTASLTGASPAPGTSTH